MSALGEPLGHAAFRMVMEFGDHVRRRWFVVALSDALRDKPVRVFLFGWPVVLARSEQGSVIALQDRCPHRGVPLSDGRIGPKGLSCRFHGWTFDQSGRCTGMPGLADDEQPPIGIRVPAFEVIERDGLVWAARAGAHPLPERVSALQSENLRFVREVRLASPVIDAQDSVLEALLARAARKSRAALAIAPELSVQGDGFRVDYEGQSARSGFLFRLFESGRMRERVYYSSLSTAQLEYRYANGGRVWITLCFSPETLLSTRVFVTLHVEGRWLPSWLTRALISPVLRIVESQTQTPARAKSAAAASLHLMRPHLQHAWSTASI
jgi:nitrite reductase/ring-hydroxylating ferredoxin subunit